MSSSQSHIVILHGWGHSAAYWSDYASRYAPGEVTVLDLPGFGAEPLASASWGIPEYASWVSDRIETLKTKNCQLKTTLIGHSFGGRIAAHIASQKPQWLDKLILVGAPCIYDPSLRVRLLKRIAKVARLLGLSSDKLSLNSELTQAQRVGMGDIYRRVVMYDQRHELPQITVPTLIVRGELDTYPDDSVCQRMHTLIVQSEYVVLPAVGHNIHLENATLLYGVIAKWLSDTLTIDH